MGSVGQVVSDSQAGSVCPCVPLYQYQAILLLPSHEDSVEPGSDQLHAGDGPGRVQVFPG